MNKNNLIVFGAAVAALSANGQDLNPNDKSFKYKTDNLGYAPVELIVGEKAKKIIKNSNVDFTTILANITKAARYQLIKRSTFVPIYIHIYANQEFGVYAKIEYSTEIDERTLRYLSSVMLDPLTFNVVTVICK